MKLDDQATAAEATVESVAREAAGDEGAGEEEPASATAATAAAAGASAAVLGGAVLAVSGAGGAAAGAGEEEQAGQAGARSFDKQPSFFARLLFRGGKRGSTEAPVSWLVGWSWLLDIRMPAVHGCVEACLLSLFCVSCRRV